MKALTISQPFASLIMSGEKFFENRTWATKHRGILLIHAGRGTQYLTKAELQHYPHGCILGAIDLRACVHIFDAAVRVRLLEVASSFPGRDHARRRDA